MFMRMSEMAVSIIACVASVSVGLKHFSLLERAKQCCARPNFCAAKKRKTPRTGRQPYGNACYAGYQHKECLVFLQLFVYYVI